MRVGAAVQWAAVAQCRHVAVVEQHAQRRLQHMQRVTQLVADVPDDPPVRPCRLRVLGDGDAVDGVLLVHHLRQRDAAARQERAQQHDRHVHPREVPRRRPTQVRVCVLRALPDGHEPLLGRRDKHRAGHHVVRICQCAAAVV